MSVNTKITYLYRDASNYKNYKDVIVQGKLSLEELYPFLYENEFFVPSEIGLDDLQGDTFSEDDHIWHEIFAVEPTADLPDSILDSQTIKNKFKECFKNNWNLGKVFKMKGLL